VGLFYQHAGGPSLTISNEGMFIMVVDLSHEDPATLSRLTFGH